MDGKSSESNQSHTSIDESTDLLRRLGAPDELISFLDSPEMVLQLLDAVAGKSDDDTNFVSAKQEMEQFIATLTRAMELLPQHGWAVSKSSNVDVLADVVRSIDIEKKSMLVAERKLVKEWNKEGALERIIQRVGLLCAGHDDLWQLFRERERLLTKAVRYHRAGDYDASIQSLFAHIDGIPKDVTGNNRASFFEGKSLKYFEDNQSFLGVKRELKSL